MRKLIFTVLIACFVISTHSLSTADEIPWMTDVQVAMVQAKNENKPVLLHFYGDFCGPCKAMDKNVFPEPTVAQELKNHFIPVKIDTSQNQATTQKYGIRGIPADVFITPQGEILHQRVGGTDARQYLQELQNVVQIVYAKSGASQNHIVRDVAPQQQLVSQNHNVSMGGGLPLQTTTNTRPPAANLSFENSTTQYEPQVVNTQIVAQNTIMPEPKTLPEILPEKTLLFDGYCPVTLSLETRWVKGQEQFFAEYEGGMFYFASEEARNMFLEVPYQYAPVASGNDIVEWTVNQKKVIGSRKYGAWFQGNIYLFTSKDNYEQFHSNPHFFAGQALQMSRLFSYQLR